MYYFNDKDNSVTCDIWIMVKETMNIQDSVVLVLLRAISLLVMLILV